MRILVCGSRSYEDRDRIYGALDLRASTEPRLGLYGRPIVIISGAARGADQIAEDWAYERGCELSVFPPEWAKYGKAAGPIRNTRMLDEGKPELVLAFVNKPIQKSRGTHHMVEIAMARKIPVVLYEMGKPAKLLNPGAKT